MMFYLIVGAISSLSSYVDLFGVSATGGGSNGPGSQDCIHIRRLRVHGLRSDLQVRGVINGGVRGERRGGGGDSW